MPSPIPSLSDIRSARERIADRLHHTPVLSATRLGARVGATLYHKCESLQKTGSFKVRGALNRISQLDDKQGAAGGGTAPAGEPPPAGGGAARGRGGGCARAVAQHPGQAKRGGRAGA